LRSGARPRPIRRAERPASRRRTDDRLRPHRARRGFTLVELVCCIVVSAVLAAFALPQFALFDPRARVVAMSGC